MAMAAQPGFSRENEYIWMPALKVWIPRSAWAPKSNQGGRISSPAGCRIVQTSDSKPESGKQADSEDFSCPICFSAYRNGEIAVLSLCMHKFCVECITKWSEVQRKCPLCKREFEGWFFDIRGPEAYREQKLLPLKRKPCHFDEEEESSSSRRPLQRARRESTESRRFSRPLPRRRHFGPSRFVSAAEKRRLEEENSAERALRWRASIYRKGVRAVPPSVKRRIHYQSLEADANERIRTEKRLEPWVLRELNAILGDGDLDLLVHFAISLWLGRLKDQDKKQDATQNSIEDEYINQLIPFLDDKASLFWHELRCFAESPFTMSTYDSVVEYRRCSSC